MKIFKIILFQFFGVGIICLLHYFTGLIEDPISLVIGLISGISGTGFALKVNIQSQKIGDNSTGIQVGGDIIQNQSGNNNQQFIKIESMTNGKINM